MRILLVEDDTDLRERLVQTLVAEGFVVDAVAEPVCEPLG